MATHSNILAWRIPWTEEPGRLQSMGSQKVGQDWSDLAFPQQSPCFSLPSFSPGSTLSCERAGSDASLWPWQIRMRIVWQTKCVSGPLVNVADDDKKHTNLPTWDSRDKTNSEGTRVGDKEPWAITHPGIKPTSPALAGGSFIPEPPGKPWTSSRWHQTSAKQMQFSSRCHLASRQFTCAVSLLRTHSGW